MSTAPAEPQLVPADDALASGYLKRCDRCPAVMELIAVARRGEWLCPECFRNAGSPWPGPGSMEEIHRAELATRAHMLDRGGKDRYLVANGKS